MYVDFAVILKADLSPLIMFTVASDLSVDFSCYHVT